MLVEVFDNDDVYMDRIKSILPEYMRDPVDYYNSHNIKPEVIKYEVSLNPIHNGISVSSPILFEEGDDLEVKYCIQRAGHVSYNEYMQFLHEAYKSDQVNIDNTYTGLWSLRFL